MINIIKENKYFLGSALLFWVYAFIVIISVSKADIHLFINSYNSPFADISFKYTTYLGDGIFALAVGIVFLFIRFRHALVILLSGLASGAIAQIIKLYLITDVPRPLNYFNMNFPDIKLHLVEGVKMHMWFSFPSGHTTSAFALFFSLSMVYIFYKKSSNFFVQFLLFAIAIFVGYSRMYLSQHFLIDVFAGSILGTVTALITYYWINSWKKEWLEKSLISIFK